MYDAFVNGDFVVRHTLSKGSAVPMDQALEKAYNKPAKAAGRIIGVTRRKEAVCKWNLIKRFGTFHALQHYWTPNKGSQ